MIDKEFIGDYEIIDTKYPRVKIVNDSLADSWVWKYAAIGNEIQKHFADYTVYISGGSYRGYDMIADVDVDSKKIRVDCYLPLHMDCEATTDWAIGYIRSVLKSHKEEAAA